jgi:CheY-like chemotaxis protein
MLGLEAARAYDGATALEIIDEIEPDLVILDVNMPGGNGINLCQMMAGDDCLRKIPVIIMTGRKDEATIRGCHELLAYYVLKSPNVWARLEPLIRELLALPVGAARPGREAAARSENSPDAPPLVDEDYFGEVLAALQADTSCPDLAADESPASLTHPRVLCIDDDRQFAMVLKRRLEQRGVEVQQAFSGMEGYRCAFRNDVQAIVLDYEMPDGNGDYLLRRLDENPVTRGIPVIALTGHRDKPLERRLTGLGVRRVLTKPPEWNALWAELRQHGLPT